MGRPEIPVPPKTCDQCKKMMVRKRYASALEGRSEYMRRRFCDQACMASWQEGRIKVPSEKAGHRQSVKLAKASCERCQGTKGLHVHHLDENPTNNSPANLLTLCSRCHRQAHSPNFDPTTGLRLRCTHCEKDAMKLGLCWTHNTRRQKYGDPLVKKVKVGSSWQLQKLG
jgi:5-methylcytosine-specific restriction endonuclease McrA